MSGKITISLPITLPNAGQLTILIHWSNDVTGNSLRQTVNIHCASVHQAAKLVAALLRVAGVTAGLAESNGSLLLGL